jgi:Peptidase inhibitor family I36
MRKLTVAGTKTVRRGLFRASAVAVVVAGGLLAQSGPASASSDGLFCMYVDSNSGGDYECYSESRAVSGWMNDQASSLYNDSSQDFCVYDSWGDGYPLRIQPGHHYANLAWDAHPVGGSWNDRISYVESC